MASHLIPLRVRRPLVIAGAIFATAIGLFSARPFAARYLEERETCAKIGNGELRLFLFTDSGSSLPRLDQGIYHFELTGYCYHAECDLDLREQLDLGVEPKMTCRNGKKIEFTRTIRHINGFFVPRALRTLKVSVRRDGVNVYDDNALSGHPCPVGFCFVTATGGV